MKNVFLFTLLILAVPVFSQSVEFAPAGATWTFTHEVWDSWQGPSSVTVEELRYTEDIIIGNLPVKVLEMEGKKFHIYQDAGKVYFKKEADAAFSLLWDFSVMPGDTFVAMPDIPEIPGLPKAKFVCTAIDSETINGVVLPRFHFDLFCGETPFTQLSSNTRFGTFSDFFVLHLIADCGIDLRDVYHFCSYSDNTLGSWQPVTPSVCAQLTSTTEIAVNSFLLSPNPANTQLNINLQNEPADGTVMYIFDPLGRMVYQQEVQQKSTAIPVADLAEGTYHISIQRNNGLRQQKRVVIAH